MQHSEISDIVIILSARNRMTTLVAQQLSMIRQTIVEITKKFSCNTGVSGEFNFVMIGKYRREVAAMD
jgi:REP element-mobilizing transposase RayT